MIADTVERVRSFDWHVPTRVLYGPGRLGDLGGVVSGLGARPLLVTDRGLAGTELVREVEGALAARTDAVTVSARVVPEPTLEIVREVLDDAREVRATVVVGVGGGSVMDAAKCVALLATNPDLDRDSRWRAEGAIFVDRADRPALPLVQVPTTVATGSEVNAVASISFAGRKRLLVGPPLYAVAAVVDPDLTATLPADLLLSGGLETIGRVLCPFLSDTGTAVGDELAAGLLRATVAAMDAVASGEATAEARATLGCGATMSMTQVSNLGRDRWGHVLWYLQNAVGRCLGVTKGTAMAALLPAYLADIRTGERLGPRCGSVERLAAFARTVWAAPGADAEADAATAVERTVGALRRWGMPSSFGDLRPSVAQLSEIIDETASLWTVAGRLRGVPRADLEAFYTAALARPAP